MSSTLDREWTTESLRVTLFPEEALTALHPQWWEEAFGSPPEQQNSEPRALKMVSSAQFEKGELILAETQTRIDWIYRVPQTTETTTIGSLPESFTSLRTIVDPWLQTEGLPVFTRVAFGAEVRLLATDRQSAYKDLASLLQALRLDLETDSDVQLQINRPIESTTVEGLELNRLSRWAVVNSLLLTLPTDVATGAQAVRSEFFTQAALDFNTDKHATRCYDSVEISALLEELYSEAIKTLNEGIQ